MYFSDKLALTRVSDDHLFTVSVPISYNLGDRRKDKTMKRKTPRKVTLILISLLLGLTLMIAFAGCGGEDDSEYVSEGEDAAEYNSDVIAPGGTISFETKDLKGSQVSSGDLFAENKVTMVNVWGTFCGPCISEMPELEAISQEYAEQGAAIVGLVCDVTEQDDSCLQDAVDIIKDSGVTYQNLYWNDEMEMQMSVTAIPTTFFVGSDGKVLGEPIIGADPDAYRSALDQYLSEEH